MAVDIMHVLENYPLAAKTEKQRKVIASAVKLFAEKGYANTSTAEIAKEAGVSEGLIFKNYRTKEQLLISIVVSFMKDFSPMEMPELLEGLAIPETTDMEAILRHIVTNRLALIEKNRAVFTVIAKEMVQSEELKRELLSFLLRNLETYRNSMPEPFKMMGGFSIQHNKELVKSVLAACLGFLITQFVILEKAEVSAADAEDLVQLLVKKMKGV